MIAFGRDDLPAHADDMLFDLPVVLGFLAVDQREIRRVRHRLAVDDLGFGPYGVLSELVGFLAHLGPVEGQEFLVDQVPVAIIGRGARFNDAHGAGGLRTLPAPPKQQHKRYCDRHR